MAASDHLSPGQFDPDAYPRRRFKVADSPSGYPAWVADVPVEHLLPHADPTRVSDEFSNRHVDALAEGLRQGGYRSSKHSGFDHWGTQGSSDPAQPVHVTVQPGNKGIDIFNGNHRTWAAHRAGLTHLPVLITDFRKHERPT